MLKVKFTSLYVWKIASLYLSCVKKQNNNSNINLKKIIKVK